MLSEADNIQVVHGRQSPQHANTPVATTVIATGWPSLLGLTGQPMGHPLYLSWYRFAGSGVRTRDVAWDIDRRLPIPFLTPQLTPWPKATPLSDYDSERSLSESLGTKTLQAKYMGPDSF